MAPEMLTGDKYNEKVDVFAFGIILYELMCGRLIVSRMVNMGGLEPEQLLEYAQQVRGLHAWPHLVHAGAQAVRIADCSAASRRLAYTAAARSGLGWMHAQLNCPCARN